MPEQLTKHSEVTLEVLRSAGARCGEGAPQSILKQCPPQRFCKLPGGEVCIYGLPEAAQMTQISASDWQAVRQALQAAHPARDAPSTEEALVAGGAGILVGVVLGVVLVRLKNRGARRAR
jgi:hypothetical protein